MTIKKRKPKKLIADSKDVKISTFFKKENTAQHQLVGDKNEKITKPREKSSDVKHASTSDNVDGVPRLPDKATLEPDLAKTFPF